MVSAKKLFQEFNLKNKISNFVKNLPSFFKYLFSKEFIFSHAFMSMIIFFLTLTSVFFYLSKYRAVEAYDAWFNEMWSVRQKVVVVNSASADATNFVVKASLPGGNLISTGLLKNDCTDFRVVDKDLNLLDYWVDPATCTSASANIFFKIPTLNSRSASTFYIYYGNSSATTVTVAQTSLFTSTIPNLKAMYTFDNLLGNTVIDETAQNNGTLINSALTFPNGIAIDNNNTFPEGYTGKGYYFNGTSVYLQTPLSFSTNLSNAYTLISFIKPEGVRANGFPYSGETYGKMFPFENIYKTGTLCNAAEYQMGDGVAACVSDGLLYTPNATTQKKTGVYNYFYDFFYTVLTRPSLSVTFNGTTQYLYQNNGINFIPYMNDKRDMGFFVKVKPYGDPGEVRTIMSFGNTSPTDTLAEKSLSLDYSVCDDGSIKLILDYNNSRIPANTLASPCLSKFKTSNKVSTSAGYFNFYANTNTWVNVTVTQFSDSGRAIFVNDVKVASDAQENVFIERNNKPIYLGKASNSTKLNFKGEVDDFVFFGQDQSWFATYYYSANNKLIDNTEQVVTNSTKKPYVIFGNSSNNFYQSGFTNQAAYRYSTTLAISSFNYNYNTGDALDFYQQYGGNGDGTLNAKPSFISNTFDLFDGSWYLYKTDFDDVRNSLTASYVKGATTLAYSNTYNLTNSSGNLIVGAYINQNPDTATYPSEYYVGGMDDIFIYNSTLSSTQFNLHSAPYNAYGSVNKSLWQNLNSNLVSNGSRLIYFSQFAPELQKRSVRWYDENYNFRAKITVSSIPALTIPDFQIQFTLNTSTPINSQKMNSDCSGIIVVDEFNRKLPFWVEGCNKAASKFSVKMNPNTGYNYDIKGGSVQNIFVYYGNPRSTESTYPVSQVFDTTVPGLHIAYTFDDDSATTAFDKSGNGINLTWVSRTNSSAGAFASAPYFNGSTNNGSGPLTRATIAGWSGLSILSWNNLSAKVGSVSRFIFNQSQTANNGFGYGSIYVAPNYYHSLGLYITNNVFTSGTSDWADTNFHHTAYTWKFGSGNSMYIYYDGAISGSQSNDALGYFSFPLTLDNFTVGSYNKTSGFWTGAVDELRIFNRELSAPEVAAYTKNTTIGSSIFDLSINTCNQVNNYCTKSFVTPSFAGADLLGKYNSNVTFTTFAEEKFVTPILYFKFNEGSGVYLKDSSDNYSNSFLGQIRTLTHPSGEDPVFANAEKCIEGQCLYFDGVNDIVEALTSPNANAAALGATANTDTRIYGSDYSYSFWIKPLTNNNQNQNIVAFENQGTTRRTGYTLYLNSNLQLVSYGSSATTYISSSAQALPVNKWSHVVFNYSSSSKANSFYINGALSNITTNTVDNAFNTTKVYFGGSKYGLNPTITFFHGYLDEVKMYNKVLSSDDILENYRKGLNFLNYNLTADAANINNFNLMAYYRFDEEGRNLGFDQTELMGEGGYSNLTQANAVGLVGNSFSVPGGTTYFSLPYSNLTNLIYNGAYSVWVKINSTTASDAVILSKSGTGSMSVKFKYSTQKYEGNICGTTLTSGSTFPTGSWDNLVVTSNSNKAKLFVNSKLEDEEYCFNNYIGDSGNVNSIRVGGDGTNTSVNGLVDEFKIYENYLSNKQVKLLFDLAPSYSQIGNNPVAFYKLDELDGTTTATDYSGNSNTLGVFQSATNLNSWDTFGKIGGSYDFTTNAASTRNMLTKATSTMTSGLTQPYSLGTWVAFKSNTGYGNYTVGYDSTLISVGNGAVGDNYANFTFVPNSAGYLNTKLYSQNSEPVKQQFSSPYFTLTSPNTKVVWNYVTATFDGRYRKTYMNGNLVAVDTNAYATLNSISGSMISLGMLGNQANVSWQLLGNLDEAKIYNYARSQEQVQNDMRNMSTNAFNGITYSAMRSNQITSIVRSSSEPNVYPIVDAKFDSVFTTGDIVFRNSDNTLSLASSGVSYNPSGVRGGAASLGTGDSLSFGNASQLNFNDGDFAISFFIKQESASNTDFTIASATNMVIRKVNNAINFSTPNITITSTSTIGSSKFTHVVIQKTNTEKVYSLYIDKNLEASKYFNDIINYSNLSFVGNSSVSYLLDELKIFDSEISQNEISNLFIGGFALKIGKQDISSLPSYEFKFESTNAYEYSSGLSSATATISLNKRAGYTGQGPIGGGLGYSFGNLLNLSSSGAVSFWFNTSDTTNNSLLRIKGPTSGNGLNIKINNSCTNSISVTGTSSTCFQSNYTNGSLVVNDSTWKHVNLNFNNGSYEMYLDGVKIGTGTYTPTSYADLVMFEFDGTADDFRIYDYQRSASQVAAEYSANKSYVYLKMDECSGNKLYNSSLNLYKPLEGIQNGTRFDSGPFTNTGFNLTRASGNLIFGNCTTSGNTNFYLGGVGKYNSSFYFDGSVWAEGNDYHSYSINQGTQASVSFWINIDTNPTQTATIFGPALDSSRGHKIEYNNRNILIKRNDNAVSMSTILTSVSTLANRTWTHVALTSDGSTYKLYFNGLLDSSAPSYTPVVNTCTGYPAVSCATPPAVIGKSFTGLLDEFKIYNFPMSQSQIKIDMNQNAGMRIE